MAKHSIISTERGNDKLVYSIYIYRKHRFYKKSCRTFWRCEDRKCKARAVTTENDSESIVLTNEHSHAAEEKASRLMKVLRIFCIVTAAALPKYKNLVRQIERKRVVQEHNPKTLAAIVIPAERQQILRGIISWLMTQDQMRNGFSSSQQNKTLIFWRPVHIDMPMEHSNVVLGYFIKFSPFTAF